MDTKIKLFIIMMILLLFQCKAYCQENDELEEIKNNFLSSFNFPINEFLNEENKIREKFSGGFSFNYPIKESTPNENEGFKYQGRFSNNLLLSASIRYSIVSSWFFSTTIYKYINEYLKAPWNPDFSYVFGYDDWRPYTLSLTYSNFGGNRLFPDKNKEEVFTDFLAGSFSLAWKFKIPKFLEKYFYIDKSSSLSGSFAYAITPKFFDLESLSTKSFKQSFRISLRYNIIDYFYITSTFFFYPIPDQQQPWDPDFTYGFGFFDWHPGTISIQYNNYSGNRFPWNKKIGSGGFENGSFSISWGWSEL
jgi:hypothetical protein